MAPLKSLRGKTGLNVSLGVVLLGGIALAVAVVGPNRPASSSVSNMATVSKGTVLAQVTATGDLSLQQSENLSFAASGTVSQISVTVGEQVSSGQTLATVDPTLAQDQVTQAQDALSAAQDALQAAESGPTAEQQTLDSDKINADETAISDAQTALTDAESDPCTAGTTDPNCATTTQIDQDRTALDTAESALQTAEDQQSVDQQVAPATVSKDQEAVDAAQTALAQAQAAEAGTVITAPTDGTILSINGFVGSQATAGASGAGTSGAGTGGGSSSNQTTSNGVAPSASGPFITMSNLSNLQVTATIGESAAANVQVNQSATVSVAAISGMVLPAEVTAITPTSPLSGSSAAPVQYAVTLELSGNVPTTVRDGESVNIDITTGEASKATYVPNTAVTTSGGKSTVTVVGSNGKQTVVPVTIGLIGTTDTQIIKGVNAGQQVLVTIPGTTSGRGLGGIGGGASASSGPAAGAPVVGRVG